MSPRLLPAAVTALALLSLTACGKDEAAGGSNVAMRDMEVIDGTANDSMVDLDAATGDGTAPANAAAANAAAPGGATTVKQSAAAAGPAANAASVPGEND